MDELLSSDLLNALTVVSGYRQLMMLESMRTAPNRDTLANYSARMALSEARLTAMIRANTEAEPVLAAQGA